MARRHCAVPFRRMTDAAAISAALFGEKAPGTDAWAALSADAQKAPLWASDRYRPFEGLLPSLNRRAVQTVMASSSDWEEKPGSFLPHGTSWSWERKCMTSDLGAATGSDQDAVDELLKHGRDVGVDGVPSGDSCLS